MTGAALRRAAAALLLAAVPVLLAAGPAGATAYRYWSFWQWSGGSWTYQQQGAAVHIPLDGSVDGWRFTLSPDGGQDTARPGGPGDFAALCADTPAQQGKKRVGVLLDFGSVTDAPSGSMPPTARTGCASVRADASSAEVLAAVAPPLRYDSAGMICAIAGYPTSGCGEAAGAAAPATAAGRHSSPDSPNSPDLGLVAGGGLVVLLGAGAWWQVHRRRQA